MLKSKPNPTRTRKDKTELPPMPKLESTYSRIVQRAMDAAKVRSGFTERVRAATRELAALVPHTRERFRAMSLLGKVLTVLVLLTLGASLGAGGFLLWSRPDPARLRAAALAKIAAGDFVAAKELLGDLRKSGAFGREDRLRLEAPVAAGMQKLRQRLQAQLEAHKSAQAWPEALHALDEMERAGFTGEAMLLARADMLRQAGRRAEARAYYERYVELYPTSDSADDALFWQAELLKTSGDAAAARKVLERLVADYPGSNFKVSARRWLDELAAADAAKH